MRIPELNKAVEAQILADHPELNGLVDFHTAFDSCSSMHICFVTTVHLTGPDAWQKLQQLTGHSGRHQDFTTLHAVLDPYCETEAESHFTIDRQAYLIGDGDDSGAVVAVGSHEVRVWVRTFL